MTNPRGRLLPFDPRKFDLLVGAGVQTLHDGFPRGARRSSGCLFERIRDPRAPYRHRR